MNNDITIQGYTDELMERYNRLAFQQEIPNVARYAFEWKILGEDCDIAGRPALASMCHSRANFYGEQAGGEYLRLIELPFSELLQVSDEMDEVGRMISGIKSLATPLQDLIMLEALTDREYANKAAAELSDLRARLAQAEERERVKTGLLKDIEWVDNGIMECCLICGANKRLNHKTGCELAAALKARTERNAKTHYPTLSNFKGHTQQRGATSHK